MDKILFRLKGFKCFKDNSFELNNLTALTGANATGKSSLIQALLLANSAMRSPIVDGNCEIALNDPSRALELGSVDNILCEGGDGKAIISINDCEFCFHGEDEVRLGNLLMHCPDDQVMSECPIRNLSYFCAERNGPRFEMDRDKTRLKDCGCHGEFAATVIENNDFTKVTASRTFEREGNDNFRITLNAWMDYIFPGISVKVSTKGETKRQVKIFNKNLSVNHSATNVGFGISYALPIIVNCLLAESNTIVAIQHPETHLHPKAQSNMGYFLAQMASAGLRILLETHSEHIINGIRRAVVSKIGLKPEDVSIYFMENLEGHITSQNITLDVIGNLSAFPVDFFDQQRQDSKAIFELISHKS